MEGQDQLINSCRIGSYSGEHYVNDLQVTTRFTRGECASKVIGFKKTKESADKRALKRKIWKWLSRVFKVLAALLSAGGAIFGLFYPIGLLESAAIAGASMLSGAAAKLCEIVQDSKSPIVY